MSGVLTRVSLTFLPHRLNVWLRFGRAVRERRRNPAERDVYFTPHSIFALVEWQGNEYGTVHWALQVLQAVAPRTPVLTVPRVKPGAEILLRVATPDKVRRVLGPIDSIEGQGIAAIATGSSYWRTVHNRGAATRGIRAVTREPFAMLRTMASGLVAMALSTLTTMPWRLVYKASRSVPLGWYFTMPVHDLRVGELVLARLRDQAAALAEARQYLPRSVPILKPVAAVPGDRICERDGALAINGRTVAHALHEDSAHRPLASWFNCRPLRVDEVLLVSTDNAASFDSRYFGPVSRAAIVGRARPLWT